jgi:hypothetical protein
LLLRLPVYLNRIAGGVAIVMKTDVLGDNEMFRTQERCGTAPERSHAHTGMELCHQVGQLRALTTFVRGHVHFDAGDRPIVGIQVTCLDYKGARWGAHQRS